MHWSISAAVSFTAPFAPFSLVCAAENASAAFCVGFLFQNFALLEGRTVAQNLQIIQKKSRTETSIEEALAAVGLTKKMNTKVYKLSGGEQQRVALARLMLKKCDVILADEPTGSLDEENADMVMNILHLLNQTGKTVVLDSVYMRSSQNSQPNSDTSDVNSRKER